MIPWKKVPEKKNPQKEDPWKNGPRKYVLKKLFSVKRMLGNLNDFFIFIDWFHYTPKNMIPWKKISGKKTPKKCLKKLFSVKRLLGNLNDFFIFINWFHYTPEKMVPWKKIPGKKTPEKCLIKIILRQKNARKFERPFYFYRLIPPHSQKNVSRLLPDPTCTKR